MYRPCFPIRLVLTFSIFIFLNACHKPDAPDNREYVVKEIQYDQKYTADYFEYNDKWELVKKRATFFYPRNSSANNEYNYTYNSLGQVSKVEIAYNSPSVRIETTQNMSYNNDGRLVTVSSYRKGTTNEQSRDEYEYIGKT